MTVTMRVEGLEHLEAQLKRLGAQVSAVLDEATMTGAEVVEGLAQQRAPGPHIESELATKTSYAAEAHIGPDEEHWYYRFFETGAHEHEIGPQVKQALAFAGSEGQVVVRAVEHPGMAASPFLRPAIDQGKQAATDAVGQVLKAAIDGVAGV